MDEVFIRIQGVQHYLWRAVDQDGVAMPTQRSAYSGTYSRFCNMCRV